MKVGKYSIQFNYRSKGYKTIDEVPYWRLYRVKRTKVKHYLPEGQFTDYGKNYVTEMVSEVIDKSVYNYKIADLESICEMMEEITTLGKGEIFVAWPRKGCENRRF